MVNSTTSKPFPHALAKILSAIFIVQHRSTSVWKKEWADLPLDMPFHQFLHPFAVVIALD